MTECMRPLQGRSAIVTGAGSGIGLAVARRLGEDGVEMLACLDLAFSDEAKEELVSAMGRRRLDFIEVDLSAEHGPESAIVGIGEAYGAIDILINNAGVSDENDILDAATWRRVMAVNLDAPFHVVRCAHPYLRRGGRIVNVSSILGRAGKKRNTAYCASKHGLLGLTKALAMDLGPQGITVNAILPGWVDTPLLDREIGLQASLVGSESPLFKARARKQIPIKRFVDSEEVAALVAYLCLEAAAAITAQGIVIDGGYMAGA